MTLCPITGKVLGQADDELTNLNADDMSENEQKYKATLTDDAGLQQLLAAQEDGQPLLVTGEDGTIYQVAGKNEQGQTILIAQGAEGEQQCVYVAADDNEDGGMINLDSAVADAMQNIATDEVSVFVFLFYFSLTFPVAKHKENSTLLLFVSGWKSHRSDSIRDQTRHLRV